MSPKIWIKEKRIRIARMIIWREDRLLVETDARLADAEQFYRLPGGHIDRGETPGACALRELEEEIGAKADSLCLWYLGENLYIRKGKPVSELAFYFGCKLTNPLPDGGPFAALEPKLRWRWLPRVDIAKYRCLPVNLFTQIGSDGPSGPRELLYIADGLH